MGALKIKKALDEPNEFDMISFSSSVQRQKCVGDTSRLRCGSDTVSFNLLLRCCNALINDLLLNISSILFVAHLS